MTQPTHAVRTVCFYDATMEEMGSRVFAWLDSTEILFSGFGEELGLGKSREVEDYPLADPEAVLRSSPFGTFSVGPDATSTRFVDAGHPTYTTWATNESQGSEHLGTTGLRSAITHLPRMDGVRGFGGVRLRAEWVRGPGQRDVVLSDDLLLDVGYRMWLSQGQVDVMDRESHGWRDHPLVASCRNNGEMLLIETLTAAHWQGYEPAGQVGTPEIVELRALFDPLIRWREIRSDDRVDYRQRFG